MATKRKWNPQTNRFEVVGGDGVSPSPMTGTTVASVPTTSVPAAPKAAQGPMVPPTTPTTAAPVKTAPKKAGGASAGGRGTTPGYGAQEYKDYAIQQAFNLTQPEGAGGGLTLAQLQALLGDGGASAAAQKAALAAAQGRAAYGGGMRAAAGQEAAGKEAQALYNQMAADEYARMTGDITARYAPQIEALTKYYGGAESDALKAITAASQAASESLAAPTAYKDLQAALLSAPTQALDIGKYGATGELAAKQAASDAETAKFISDLMNRGYQQTQAINTDYMTALKNAVAGTEQQARGQLASTVAGLQAQDVAGLRSAQQTETANAAAMRDQLLKAGIEALMSGKTTAATTRASTETSYGQYKPKPKAKPKQGKKG